MKNGGYQVIDLKGMKITAGASAGHPVISGIHSLIEGSNKVKLLSGLVVGNVEYDDMIVLFTVSGTSFVASVAGGTLTVTQNDEIKFTA